MVGSTKRSNDMSRRLKGKVTVVTGASNQEGEMMRAVRAESFTGYGGLKLVEVPRPRGADGRILVRVTAAGVTPLEVG
jgi:hypothetical protein